MNGQQQTTMRRLAVVVGLAMFAAACTSQDTEQAVPATVVTTSTVLPTTSRPVASTTSTTAPSSSTSTTSTTTAPSTTAPSTTLPADPSLTTIPGQAPAPSATTIGGGALPLPNDPLINTALSYIGAVAPTEPPSGDPVVIGFVNQEAGSAKFPESTFGADAAVAMLNASLDGINGRPVELRKCTIRVASDGGRCALELVADPLVQAVVIGTILDGEAALLEGLGTTKPVIVANPLTLRQYASNAVSFTPGPPTLYRGLAVAAVESAVQPAGVAPGVAKVTVVISDTAAFRNAAGTLVEPALTQMGVTTVNRISVTPGASFDQISLSLAAADLATSQAIIMLGEPPACAALAATLATATTAGLAWGATPVITTEGCQGNVMNGYLTSIAPQLPPVAPGETPPPPVAIAPLPEGWIVGGFAGAFSPKAADQQASTLQAMLTYSQLSVPPLPVPASARSEYSNNAFGAMLTVARLLNYLGLNGLDAERFRTALLNFRGPAWGYDGKLACGEQAPFVGLCGAQIRVFQTRGAERVPADVGISGNIRPSSILIPT